MNEEPQAQLIITLDANGNVNVNGPLTKKLLCYGMLDCARDAIRDFVAKNKDGAIIVPFPHGVKKHDA